MGNSVIKWITFSVSISMLSFSSQAAMADAEIQRKARRVNSKILASKSGEVVTEMQELIDNGYKGYRVPLAMALMDSRGDKSRIAGLLYDAATDPKVPDSEAVAILEESAPDFLSKTKSQVITEYTG